MDPEYDSQQFDDLKFQALQGDIHAYEEYYLRGHYGDENCLALAILMAKKYKYTIAFYDVYYILTEFYKRNDMPMDSSTVNYAIGFLKDGAELFDSKCCTELCRLHLTGEYVEKVKMDLRKMLSKVLLDYYEAFEDKGIDVKIELEEGNSIIYALEEDIERILLNLIKNVLVHGDKTCYIALRCQWKNVEINIFNETDENLPQNPDKVFDRYFRGDVARSSQESTGLGLAITKGLVENNDGKIECQIKDKLFGMILSFATMD